MHRKRLIFAFSLSMSVLVSSSALFAADAKDKAADKSADKSAPAKKSTNGKSESLTNAVTELKKEFADFVKDPANAKLRALSDFFTSPPEDASKEQVFSMLQRNLGSNPIEDAYIKWQLLSAIPKAETFEPKDLQMVYRAYQSAPNFVPRYGMDLRQRREVESLVSVSKTKEQFDNNRDRLEQARAPYKSANEIVKSYRNRLFTYFPRGLDLYSLMLEELKMRAKVAGDTTFIKEVKDSMRSWISIDSPDPRQLQGLLDLINKTRGFKGAEFTDDLQWTKEDTAKIKSGDASIKNDAFDDIIKEIKTAQKNPQQNELKFKSK